MLLTKFRHAFGDHISVHATTAKNMLYNRLFDPCLSQRFFSPTLSSAEINVMTVEEDYDGPELEEGKVTEKFVLKLMDTFAKQGKLHQKYACQMLLNVKDLLMRLPSLVDIHLNEDEKITVCGDIHGQFYDLMNIFNKNGLPSSTNPYLFNGDFVDRGAFSVECVLTLFGFKLLYPEKFHLARGNHETLTMNLLYGFDSEVKAKYNASVAQLFTDVFNWLPLAHCINKKVFVVHGGLFSKDNVTLEDIRSITRNRQPPGEGIMCDALWSDPQSEPGRSPSRRGVSVQFGPDVTESFLRQNDLHYVIRSHELKSEGYELAHGGKCITVFSAPNYCDCMGNKGAFLTIHGKTLKPLVTQFLAVNHPAPKIVPFKTT